MKINIDKEIELLFMESCRLHWTIRFEKIRSCRVDNHREIRDLKRRMDLIDAKIEHLKKLKENDNEN